ncbi:MAG: GNAT family N-acetyltransferase [Actinomycetota bacterium]|nr:GNAT family N-acetyltransferase [Actinomycetota bacterium]
MELTARRARNGDVFRLVSLYNEMEREQTVRKPIWALTDGLDKRFDLSLFRAIQDDGSFILVGEIDASPVGFVWATVEPMLARAGGTKIGRLRLIYTEPDARGVGVGHVMLTEVMGRLRERGIRHFDAPVGPGQRAAKNFFESHGFAARSIIMHTADPDPDSHN